MGLKLAETTVYGSLALVSTLVVLVVRNTLCYDYGTRSLLFDADSGVGRSREELDRRVWLLTRSKN